MVVGAQVAAYRSTRHPVRVTIELRHVCVYCGSSPGADPAYAEMAVALGRELVRRDIGLVYGGGAVGLMGILADSVLAAGGHVIGIIPEFLHSREIHHEGVSDLRIVSSMHERKSLMADSADAFVALPGGIGTFEELFEALTWTQLGVHDKPIGLLDVADFWTPLIALVDRAVKDKFLKPDAAAALMYATSPAGILDGFADFVPPDRNKWFDLDET